MRPDTPQRIIGPVTRLPCGHLDLGDSWHGGRPVQCVCGWLREHGPATGQLGLWEEVLARRASSGERGVHEVAALIATAPWLDDGSDLNLAMTAGFVQRELAAHALRALGKDLHSFETEMTGFVIEATGDDAEGDDHER